METDHIDPRQQLNEFNAAVHASETHGWQLAPKWLFPLFALAGPAIVVWNVSNRDSMDGQATLLRLTSILMWVVALGALLLATLRERASAKVRPKPPIQGGRTTAWMFLANFAVVLGLLLTNNLLPHVRDWPLAVGSYLWLTAVPWALWNRHVKTLTEA